ncbi:hypothetical protein ACFL2Y_02740 [Candidatus Omnitrophota bacterium]
MRKISFFICFFVALGTLIYFSINIFSQSLAEENILTIEHPPYFKYYKVKQIEGIVPGRDNAVAVEDINNDELNDIVIVNSKGAWVVLGDRRNK